MNSWGLHLLLDCKNGDPEKISSKENILKFVDTLVERIDMIKYGPCWCEHFATHDPLKSGHSFIQMIETSNITGHFVDSDRTFYIDVFSCKDFDMQTVLATVNEFFGTTKDDLRIKLVQRDAKF